MPGYFVTAAGTNIGKTFLTAGLVRLLRARGENASAIKPVASGFAMETAALSDPGVLLAAMGEAATPERLMRISPWRFKAALSPDMAARHEGREIAFHELVAFCRMRLAEAQGPMFIEGVGGVMVPLDARHTVIDWMAALDLPVVLVGGSYLGAISHTLTALDALVRAGFRVAVLVVNESREVPLHETISTLARFSGGVEIAPLRRAGCSNEAEPDFDCIWQALNRGNS